MINRNIRNIMNIYNHYHNRQNKINKEKHPIKMKKKKNYKWLKQFKIRFRIRIITILYKCHLLINYHNYKMKKFQRNKILD